MEKSYTKFLLRLFVVLVSIVVMLFSCQSERYRKDRKNKMTRKAKKANDYLSNQAKEITKENLDEKDERRKEANKRNEKVQERLNDLNQNTSKVKKRNDKKNPGKYTFY